MLDAFGRFDPRMAEIAARFFEQHWIDAQPRPGKDSGAFCHPVVPSAHPYMLMNFYGRPRDVTTLAHELGHGVHQVLAAGQGTLMADTPLTSAESASVFGEMLVFRALLDQREGRGPASADAGRQGREHAEHGGPTDRVPRVRAARARRSAARANWRSSASARSGCRCSAKASGRYSASTTNTSYFWAYIPHFIHSPFYVYAYAFGDCLVNSLYQVYSEGHSGFQDKYFAMLRAGGTLRHRELLQAVRPRRRRSRLLAARPRRHRRLHRRVGRDRLNGPTRWRMAVA